ncbi:MAG: hypothetical protein HY048_11720 [Acidobacteria bacterium]|nr:hypothetical protein [Acidobacteriota bacterium]
MKHIAGILSLVLVSACSSTPESAPPAGTAPPAAAPGTSTTAAKPRASRPRPTPEHITTKTYEVPAGSEISVRNAVAIDSATATDGQTFEADVTKDVLDADGKVVIPDGADALIVIKSAGGGQTKGASDLILDLKSVSVGGRQYALNTVDLAEKGRDGLGKNKRTAEFVGGGAAIGAVIGAITGGGKGAAIGGGAGAGGGALAEVLTKGGSIKIPAETELTFKLETPLKVVGR